MRALSLGWKIGLGIALAGLLTLAVVLFFVGRGTASPGNPEATAAVIVQQTLTAQPATETPPPAPVPATNTPEPGAQPTSTSVPVSNPTAVSNPDTGTWADQLPQDGSGMVEAGKDFFAIEVVDRPDGYKELVFATNGDGCKPSPVLWKFVYDPSSRLAPQWSQCDVLEIVGTGVFSMTLVPNPDFPVSPWTMRLGGSNGGYNASGTDNAFTPTDTSMDLGAGQTLSVAISNGSFYLQLVPGKLSTGSFDFELQPDGWSRLKKGALDEFDSAGNPMYCAWASLWKVEATAGVVVEWPRCVEMVLTGSGTVTVTVKPDPIGYDTSNISGYGLALWPTGEGGTYDVLLTTGTWERNIPLDTGSDGINFPKDSAERSFVIHLQGGRANIPLGDITRDESQPDRPLVLPKR